MRPYIHPKTSPPQTHQPQTPPNKSLSMPENPQFSMPTSLCPQTNPTLASPSNLKHPTQHNHTLQTSSTLQTHTPSLYPPIPSNINHITTNTPSNTNPSTPNPGHAKHQASLTNTIITPILANLPTATTQMTMYLPNPSVKALS
jgi:hypothetical protein